MISDNCQGSADTRNESWKVEKELGKGAFGTVFLVTSCKTGQPWAMKVLYLKKKVFYRFFRWKGRE